MLYLMVAGPRHGHWEDLDFALQLIDPGVVHVLYRAHAGFSLEPYGSDFAVARYFLRRFAFVGTEAYLDVFVHDALDITRASVFIDALRAACDPHHESSWRYV